LADGWFYEDPAFPGWQYRILYDEEYPQPRGDCLAPAMLIDRRGSIQFAKEVYQTSHEHHIERAWRHFNNPTTFERYLRLAHGTTCVEQFSTPEETIIIFDTNGFREHAGISGHCDLTREKTEWRAWLDGDVFGVQVQQRTGSGPDDWTVRDEIWGLYSWDYAISEATRMLASATGSQVTES